MDTLLMGGAEVNHALYLHEYFLCGMVAIDGNIIAVVQIIVRDRLRLVMINGDAVTNRIEVVICATTHFATLDKTLNQ